MRFFFFFFFVKRKISITTQNFLPTVYFPIGNLSVKCRGSIDYIQVSWRQWMPQNNFHSTNGYATSRVHFKFTLNRSCCKLPITVCYVYSNVYDFLQLCVSFLESDTLMLKPFGVRCLEMFYLFNYVNFYCCHYIFLLRTHSLFISLQGTLSLFTSQRGIQFLFTS